MNMRTKVDTDNQTIIFACGCRIEVETFDHEGERWVNEECNVRICKTHTEQAGASYDPELWDP